MSEQTGFNIPIVDSHVHYPSPSHRNQFVSILDQNHIIRFNAVCVPHPTRLNVTPEALHLKAHYPQRVYVSGGMDFSVFFTHPNQVGRIFADHVNTLLEMGCDGVKMWEGKPDIRKKYSIPPFDSPAYEPYWARLAERKMPLVFHLNDPATFWNWDTLPDFARRDGWFYGDGSYVTKEAQYDEVFNVLDRHPDLKVVFVHFCFLSGELERLGDLFERYPNMHVDITPGSEMYLDFSAHPQTTHDFFIRYQDRILYGTDYAAGPMLTDLVGKWSDIDPLEAHNLFRMVQSFLEVDGPYDIKKQDGSRFWNMVSGLQGIGLSRPALENIYFKNFDLLFGLHPRPLNPGKIVVECERLIHEIRLPGGTLKGAPADVSQLEMVKNYFQGSLS